MSHPRWEPAYVIAPPNDPALTTPAEYVPLDPAVLRLAAERHPDLFATYRVAVQVKHALEPRLLSALHWAEPSDRRVTFGQMLDSQRLHEAAGWTQCRWAPNPDDARELQLTGVRAYPERPLPGVDHPGFDRLLGDLREADGGDLRDECSGQAGGEGA